uniref:Secreted protein n=2 Tax=Oryza TaxID=4527 RepID=A0A0E0GI60_ORYNI
MSRHLKIPSLLWSAVGLAMVTISKRLQSSFWEVQMKRNENGSYSVLECCIKWEVYTGAKGEPAVGARRRLIVAGRQ